MDTNVWSASEFQANEVDFPCSGRLDLTQAFIMVIGEGIYSELLSGYLSCAQYVNVDLPSLGPSFSSYILSGRPIPNPWLPMTCQSVLSTLIFLLLSSWPMTCPHSLLPLNRPINLIGSKTELLMSLPPLHHFFLWSSYLVEWHKKLTWFSKDLFHPPTGSLLPQS